MSDCENYSYVKLIRLIKSKRNNENYKVLNAEEERALIEKYNGDTVELKNQLINHNLTLVVPFIKKYSSMLDADDIFQEGVIGLTEAAERFDINAGNKFSTYAYFWVRKYVLALYKKSNEQLDGSTNGMVLSLNYDSDDINYNNSRIEHMQYMLTDELTPQHYMLNKDNDEYIEYLVYEMLTDGIINNNECNVLVEIYYNNRNKLAISKLMGISSTMVNCHEKNAFRKMKSYLKNRIHINKIEDLKYV